MKVKRLFRRTLKPIRNLLYNAYLDSIYKLEGIEGINRILLTSSNAKYILTKFGARIGEGTIVYPGITIHAADGSYSNLIVGMDCRIGRQCFLDLTDGIEIRDNSNIGMRSVLLTHLNIHNIAEPAMKEAYPKVSGKIEIGNNVVLFANVTILHGVNIGDCSIIGAGAVVSNDVPSLSVVLGNPGRIVRKIREEKI